jgi:hypothetical protein
MHKHLRDFICEADRLGVNDILVEQGAKSIRFTGTKDGMTLVLTLPISALDPVHGHKNNVAALRRLVREATGTTTGKKVTAPRARPRRRRRKPSPPRSNRPASHSSTPPSGLPCVSPVPGWRGAWDPLIPLLAHLRRNPPPEKP